MDRVKHEGDSFLTITLPDFGKAFERALDQGEVTPFTFIGFQYRDQLPKFLGGLLEQVFDRGSGRLLEMPSIAAIQTIRQVTLSCGKIKRSCSDERISTAYQAYLQCELDVSAGDLARSSVDLMDYWRVANLLWRQLYSRLDRRIYDGELIPAHGPGATADGLKGNQKFTFQEWTLRLERLFPYLGWASPSWSLWREVNDHVTFREPGAEIPVKVIHVPKTLKTPRIIAEEPTHMMYMQQAILELFKEEIRADPNALNFVCFDSQVPNQLLAQKGSRDGSLATLDLKEASDRVSNQLVGAMLYSFPTLNEAVQVTRSLRAQVNGQVVTLSKFASMGSALTFPIEALVFTTLVFLGIEKVLRRPLTQRDVKNLYGSVRVYGDDIVIPVEYVDSVIDTLHHFGAVVNTNKSFWIGKFRESCGEEYYAGYPVGIARVRKDFPTSRTDGEELSATVALRNQLFELGGYDHTVDWLDTIVSGILPRYPIVTRDSGALGRWTHDDSFTVDRMDRDTQTPMVKAYVRVPRVPKNSIDGYPALLKLLLKRGKTPIADKRHLSHSGRPSVVDIKLRYVRAGGNSGYSLTDTMY